LLTLNWYSERRETSPTLVCISPNRIPETDIYALVSMSANKSSPTCGMLNNVKIVSCELCRCAQNLLTIQTLADSIESGFH
jgi:hypothetical protein